MRAATTLSILIELCAAIASAMGAAGCSDAPLPTTTPGNVVASGDLAVSFHLETGAFDVARGGSTVVMGAAADALVDDGSGPRRISFRDACTRAEVSEGVFTCDAGATLLTLRFDLPPGGSHLTASLELANHGTKPLVALSLAPLALDAATGGALVLGADPRRHNILENGRFVVLDETAQLFAGDVAPFALGFALPIPVRGNSVSNWSHVVADLDDKSRSLVAGFLTADHAIPTIGIGFDADVATPIDNKTPFTTYAAESSLVFHGKPLAPGASIASELFYLDPLPADPLEGLERFADAIAAEHGITAWPARGAGHFVPCEWNSWSGGSSTGGYGQSIDEALILANRDVFKRELEPFGATYFPIDDGWELNDGDWQWKPDTFPKGGAGTAAEIAATGLIPGLWSAPFSAVPGSMTAAAHPDWLMPKESGIVGEFGGKDHQTIDPSNPAVRDYLHAMFNGIRSDGFLWAKVDFTYLALLGRLQFDQTQTNVEAWRSGWQQIKNGLGPDVFLLGIGVMGPNIGVLDSMRLTQDNGPRWDEDDPDDSINNPHAFKGTVRTGSRRFFYQNRVWVSHDDSIYFRPWPNDGSGVPPISLEESRAFATWIALGGGVVELGDKLEDVGNHADWIDIVRRILPAWPTSARPLDVMTRDYPEQWSEHVIAPAGEWDLVGLINWGKNRDHTQNPPAALGETPRTYALHCDSPCLAYEFWSGAFLGVQSGDFTIAVDPRRAKVIALRPVSATPQFLGTNRHVTMGATDMGTIAWDSTKRTLSGSLLGSVGSADAPWSYALAFYAPAGFTLNHTEIDGVASPAAKQDGNVVSVGFALPASAQSKKVAFRIVFQ